jgi:Fe-S cluster assembly protein SufD
LIAEVLPKNEPLWVRESRKNALVRAKSLPLPSFKYGLRVKIYPKELLSFILTEQHLAGVPRVMIKKRSSTVLPFDQAWDKVKPYLFSVVKPEGFFTTVHAAVRTQGLLIEIPQNTEDVISLVFDSDSRAQFDHILIIAKKHSKATITITIPESNKAELRHEIIEVIAEENAEITIKTMQKNKGMQIITRKANIKKNAYVSWIDATINPSVTTGIMQSVLLEQGASTSNYGLFYADKEQIIDIKAQAIHKASQTTSNLFTKGAVQGNATAVYRGLIEIAQGANKSSGYQKVEGLLLSKNATMHAVPDLKITTNDVRCSHGATIRKLDEDKLFYLKTRGISEAKAKELLIMGFFEEIMERIPETRESIEVKLC